MPVELQVSRQGMVIRRAPLEATIEVGRRRMDEHDPSPAGRFLIAETEETSIPRSWFSITQLSDAEVRIDNLHANHLVHLATGETVPPGESLAVLLPATVELQEGHDLVIDSVAGAKVDAEESFSGIRSLAPLSEPPRADTSAGPSQLDLRIRPLADRHDALDAAAVVSLVRKALAVVTEAVGSDAFLEAAVRATAEIAGLDRATILAYAPARGTGADDVAIGDQSLGEGSMLQPAVSMPEAMPRRSADDGAPWPVRVQFLSEHAQRSTAPPISHTVLEQVRRLHATQIYEPDIDTTSRSLAPLNSVVAAPILDRSGNLAAVLYGDRWMAIEGEEPKITDLEATLVEVLAGAVAGGLARHEEERSRAHLSEFFSPRVASLLTEHPERLKARDAQVSVLFCDVRGFSGVTERFGPEKTIEWINDVLTELSRCVVDSDGVLVDYVGDELLAMWGAPQRQEDHAPRAISTAMEMFAAVARLRARWDRLLGATVDVGIGINSGAARVGNVGSKLKFKYGVLGNTVNVGSRLQGVTQRFGVRCIASETTIGLVGRTTSTRRLARIRVVGIEEPVSVFECIPDAGEDWQRLRDEYEAALLDYEAGQHGSAVHRLGRLLQLYPRDRPSALLLARAARELTDPSPEFVSVWELQSK